jgi:hypothetical protein
VQLTRPSAQSYDLPLDSHRVHHKLSPLTGVLWLSVTLEASRSGRTAMLWAVSFRSSTFTGILFAFTVE